MDMICLCSMPSIFCRISLASLAFVCFSFILSWRACIPPGGRLLLVLTEVAAASILTAAAKLPHLEP